MSKAGFGAAKKAAPAPKAKPKAPTVSHCGVSVAQEKKWQAQDDLRTMQRAAEVKADPSRVKAAQAEAQSQIKALSSVTKK